jgi:hypothetical protein
MYTRNEVKELLRISDSLFWKLQRAGVLKPLKRNGNQFGYCFYTDRDLIDAINYLFSNANPARKAILTKQLRKKVKA